MAHLFLGGLLFLEKAWWLGSLGNPWMVPCSHWQPSPASVRAACKISSASGALSLGFQGVHWPSGQHRSTGLQISGLAMLVWRCQPPQKINRAVTGDHRTWQGFSFNMFETSQWWPETVSGVAASGTSVYRGPSRKIALNLRENFTACRGEGGNH